MGVSCRIYIRTPREGIHRAGEPISGILSYAIDEPTEYQSAILYLVGAAKCKWRERHSNNHVTYGGSEKFLFKHLNILNNQPNENVTLQVGAYEFRFQFVLPFDIPSSFEDKDSHVKYHVKAKFVKSSFLSLARKFEKQITVYGNVTSPAESLTYGLEKKLFKIFSSKEHIVKLKVNIEKSFLTPGENARLDLSVNNDTDTVVILTTDLCCRTNFASTPKFFSPRTTTVDKVIEGCKRNSITIPENKTTKFSCIVPTLPHLYTIQHCKVVTKEYYIRVTVKLDFPHRNATCLIPVVIGEGRSGDCSGILELEDNIETSLEAGISDLPPSYWEVMNEDKSHDENDSMSKEKQ